MAECPVCQAQYVNGKVDRCHVCGWQLNNTGISRLGPFRLEHQVSKTALMALEAWARHMWATVQQQKNRIAQLQSAQPVSHPEMLSGQKPESLKPAQPHFTEESADLIEWIVGCFTQADQERSQLLFQLSQLRVELQRLAARVEGTAPAQIAPQSPALALEQGSLNPEQQAQLTAIQEAQGSLAAAVRQLQERPPAPELALPTPEEMTAQVQPYIEGRLATIQTEIYDQTMGAIATIQRDHLSMMGQISALDKQHQMSSQQWREWHDRQTATQTQLSGQLAQLQTHQGNFAHQLTRLEQDQGQWAAPIAELQMLHNHHSQQLTDLAHHVRQYQTQLNHQLASLTAQQQDSIAQLNHQVASLTAQQQDSIAQLNHQVAQCADRLQALQTEQGEQQAHLEQRMTEREQRVDQQVATLHDNHGQRLERLEGAISHQTQTLYNQNSQIQQQQTQLEQVFTAQSAATATLADLQTQITHQAAAHQGHQTLLATLQLQGEAILTQQDQQQQQLAALHQRIAVVQESLQGEQAEKIAPLYRELEALRTQLEEIQTREALQQAHQGQVDQQLASLQGQWQTHETAIAATQAQLTQEQAALMAQLQTHETAMGTLSQLAATQAQTIQEQADLLAQLHQLTGQMNQVESGLAGVQQALQNIPRVITPSNRSTAAVYTRYQQSSN
ncbi:hypothetical protein VB712_13205 [Spirulina sp. CCNP1310]|uniref:hypothetical protein n=1 Tax=Spirulina sp. CCNP1310 TaxID=3110249 RepID=UPI002B21A2D6|nr:hypothetical protein [Spirulina sp. CCNP1310]MEA5420182.1 hypothetical protein [Spirulina sp. CCNP1310]